MDEIKRFIIQEKIKYYNTLINVSIAFLIICITIAGILFPFGEELRFLSGFLICVTIVGDFVFLYHIRKNIKKIKGELSNFNKLMETKNVD